MNLKFALITSGVALALVGGIFVIGATAVNNKVQSPPAGKSIGVAPSETTEKKSRPQLVEALESLSATKQAEQHPAAPAKAKKLSASNDNLTQAVAERLSTTILNGNPADILSKNPRVINPKADSLINGALSETLTNFDYSSLDVVFPESSVRISPENSAAAYDAYRNAFSNALVTRLDDLGINTSLISLADFTKLRTAIALLIDDLKTIPAPKDIAKFHAEKISSLMSMKNALEIIEGSNEDPLKALVAIQFLQGFNLEFVTLAKDIQSIKPGPMN